MGAAAAAAYKADSVIEHSHRHDLSWHTVFPNRKEPKANPSSDNNKDIISGLTSVGGREEDNVYAKVYHKDGTEVDLTKNSLPSGGKYEKVNVVYCNDK